MHFGLLVAARFLSVRRAVVRRVALLALAALCPTSAFALNEIYEGQLIPRTSEAPIAITVQIEELGGFLTGRVKTAYPLKGNSTIDAGRNVAGYCNLASTLSSSISLRLYGNCNSTSFEGYYTIYYTGTKNLARGTFRLTRKTDSKASGLSAADISASAQVACVKSNARCLTGCPRGDTDVEYLCANHCRTKFLACKGKASKILSDSDSE